MISAVICMSLRRVWHLCINLPCVSVLFWLIYIARYVFGCQSIDCRAVIRTVCKLSRVLYLHSTFFFACPERYLCFLQLSDRAHVSGARCISLNALIAYLPCTFVWMKVDLMSHVWTCYCRGSFLPGDRFYYFRALMKMPFTFQLSSFQDKAPAGTPFTIQGEDSAYDPNYALACY